jgi:hypothetical protein
MKQLQTVLQIQVRLTSPGGSWTSRNSREDHHLSDESRVSHHAQYEGRGGKAKHEQENAIKASTTPKGHYSVQHLQARGIALHDADVSIRERVRTIAKAPTHPDDN